MSVIPTIYEPAFYPDGAAKPKSNQHDYRNNNLGANICTNCKHIQSVPDNPICQSNQQNKELSLIDVIGDAFRDLERGSNRHGDSLEDAYDERAEVFLTAWLATAINWYVDQERLKAKREVLEHLHGYNGAIIHDCGRRVDNILYQSVIEAELDSLESNELKKYNDGN